MQRMFESLEKTSALDTHDQIFDLEVGEDGQGSGIGRPGSTCAVACAGA